MNIKDYMDHIDELKIVDMPSDQQETAIGWCRPDERAVVCVTDNTTLTRIKKLLSGGDWTLDKVYSAMRDDDPYAVSSLWFSCPVECISFRKNKTTRELTEEQRDEVRERFKYLRGQKK